jgi:hypothetical protein
LQVRATVDSSASSLTATNIADGPNTSWANAGSLSNWRPESRAVELAGGVHHFSFEGCRCVADQGEERQARREEFKANNLDHGVPLRPYKR